MPNVVEASAQDRARLVALLDYVAALVREGRTLVRDVEEYKSFRLDPTAIDGLPGITLNAAPDETGPIWLQIDRLQEERPPSLPERLAGIVQLADDPDRDPVLTTGDPDNPERPGEDSIREAFEAYLAGSWRPWAESEKPRRQTIRIYRGLFTMRQSARANGTEELLWGLGMVFWATKDGGGTEIAIRHPLLTVPLVIDQDPRTFRLLVRPDLDRVAQVETGTFEGAGLRGLADWAQKVRQLLTHPNPDQRLDAQGGLVPFDPSGWEPLLRDFVALKSDGALEDREPGGLPPRLTVVASSRIFARRPSQEALLWNLEALKAEAETKADLPEAVLAMVRDPADHVDDREPPKYRRVSFLPGVTHANGSDLFFPKPYNAEQVRIVERLAVRPAVVVEGPPGTGKSHTIANIVCHWLARGKRVLVTAKTGQALAVVKDKLPEQIRPLAVTFLGYDPKQKRELSASIQTIREIRSKLDRRTEADGIRQLQGELEKLHAELAGIHHDLDKLGQQALADLILDGEAVKPADAARELARAGDEASWLPDRIDTRPEHAPPLTDAEMARLRDARAKAGRDLDLVGVVLPLNLPSDQEVIAAHRALLRRGEIEDELRHTPPLRGAPGQEELEAVVRRIAAWQGEGRELAEACGRWFEGVAAGLRRAPPDPRVDAILSFHDRVSIP
ncbi:MAG: AAA family ATPase [Thermaurantiacus sp.]|nr:AAA family ATPase [Thermaurantiacus sp.]